MFLIMINFLKQRVRRCKIGVMSFKSIISGGLFHDGVRQFFMSVLKKFILVTMIHSIFRVFLHKRLGSESKWPKQKI